MCRLKSDILINENDTVNELFCLQGVEFIGYWIANVDYDGG